MGGGNNGRKSPPDLSDGAVWRRACATDAPEDGAARFLDLAGFADDSLEPDERAYIAELIAADPALAEDVAAARTVAAIEIAPEPVVRRATALVGDNVVALPPRRGRHLALLRDVASWSGLAAAMVVAGWLGFTLGVNTSLSLARNGQSEDGLLQQMLDPSPGFIRDPSEGPQT